MTAGKKIAEAYLPGEYHRCRALATDIDALVANTVRMFDIEQEDKLKDLMQWCERALFMLRMCKTLLRVFFVNNKQIVERVQELIDDCPVKPSAESEAVDE